MRMLLALLILFRLVGERTLWNRNIESNAVLESTFLFNVLIDILLYP